MSGSAATIAARAPDPATRSSHPLLRAIARIWTIHGEVPLGAGLSRQHALDRLAALLDEPGTMRERLDDALLFTKTDPAAQDRLSVFDRGTLSIGAGKSGPVLRYRLVSRILLYCFLAPLMFLAIAQFTAAVATLGGHKVEKAKAEKPPLPMNPIDKALGAPAPDKKKKKDGGAGDRDKKPSPTPANVFAGIFAALYAVGRILEARLAKRLFGRCLAG